MTELDQQPSRQLPPNETENRSVEVSSSAPLREAVRSQPGLWDDPEERCPFCVEAIKVRKQARTTFPCSVDGCQTNYHCACLIRSPWAKVMSRDNSSENFKCPKCFVQAIAAGLDKKKIAIVRQQLRRHVPETLYPMKRQVAEWCGLVESQNEGFLSPLTNRLLSDNSETAAKVKDLYGSITANILAENGVTFKQLRNIGYTLPMMCRDFYGLSPKSLYELRFSPDEDFPAVINDGAFLVERCSMNPMTLRKLRFTMKHLKNAQPTAEQMLAMGLTLPELLMFGFTKQDFAQFKHVSQNDWINLLGMTADVFALLKVQPTDFAEGKTMAGFHAQSLIDVYDLAEDVPRMLQLGLVSVEKPSKGSKPQAQRITWIYE